MNPLPETISFVEAEQLAKSPASLDDARLGLVWKAYASQISYHNADDYGDEWKIAAALKPTLDELDAEHDRRALTRPSRAGYLL